MLPAVHINDHLKRLLPIVGKNRAGAVAQMLQTPYLTFEDHDHKGVTGVELREAGLIDERGLPRTPFPVFRFCLEDYKKRTIFGCVQRNDGEIQVVALHRGQDIGVGPLMWAVTYKRWSTDGDLEYDGRMYDIRTLKDVTDVVKKCEEEKQPLPSMDGMTPELAKAIIPGLVKQVKAKEHAIEIQKSEHDLIRTAAHATGTVHKNASGDISPFVSIYHSLMMLCYEYLAPHNFMAKVTPGTQGKSVEWVRAREHYTVIHRHHSANNAAVKDGATIAHNGNATRLAHSRRAHTKLLTHERYKFKRGQRIFVRASWVGPKEWKDTAGQTYQILTELRSA